MKKLIIAVAVLVTAKANAGFMLEPYLGYETGSVKVTDSAGTTVGDYNLTGMGYGARLGYHFISAWVAADVCTSSGKEKDNTSVAADADFTQTSMGVTVGADLPGVRFFAGYGFSQEYKTKYSNGTEDKWTGGYTKVGFGFRPIPKLTLNLEYKMNTYNKYTDTAGTSVDLSTTGAKVTHNPIFVSVGFSF